MPKKLVSDMNRETEVEVKHPFIVYIAMGTCSFRQMMDICDAFDVWEVTGNRNILESLNTDETKEKGNTSVEQNPAIIVDVVEVSKKQIVIKITPQKALTYAGIYNKLVKLMKFVAMRTQGKCDFEVMKIIWEKHLLGVPSDIKEMGIGCKDGTINLFRV